MDIQILLGDEWRVVHRGIVKLMLTCRPFAMPESSRIVEDLMLAGF